MSEPQNPPKLFLHKPKKGSNPPGGEVGEKAARVPVQGPAVAVPSAPMKPPLWYRYRAGVGALLLVNLGIGGYVLSRPRPELDAQLNHGEVKLEPEKAKSAPEQAPAPVVTAAAAAPEWVAPPKATISEEEQRQVLQWVLEEKRKVKAQNKAEKARIDEEKRMLKQFLRVLLNELVSCGMSSALKAPSVVVNGSPGCKLPKEAEKVNQHDTQVAIKERSEILWSQDRLDDVKEMDSASVILVF